MVNFSVIFKSGTSAQNTYTDGSNVSMLSLTNTDQDYYQNGVVTLYNAPSSQDIGDAVEIRINDSLEFNGYVSRRSRLIKGVIEDTYSLVGKTYDLWRYYTGNDVIFTDKTTTYIASSLVGTYCPGISGTNIYTNSGTTINGDMIFDYEVVGDAIIRLSNLDGYMFYVDNDNNLVYEPASEATNMFNIVESDIIEMQPIEEADEDLVNDCLVIGGSTYSQITTQSLYASSNPIAGGDMLYAQKFRAEDPILSAVKFRLNRTLDPYQPSPIAFEVWENSDNPLFTDPFNDWTYLNSGASGVPESTYYNMVLDDGYLTLARRSSSTIGVNNRDGDYAKQVFAITMSSNIDGVFYRYALRSKLSRVYYFHFGPTSNTGEPQIANALWSGSDYLDTSYDWHYLTGNLPKVSANQTYCFVISNTWALPVVEVGLQSFQYNSPYEINLNLWHYKGEDQTWNEISQPHMLLSNFDFAYWYESGQVDSSVNNRDIQYMKVDLGGVTSSNSIFISGTNSGSANWCSLEDNIWYDFGFNNTFSGQVRYRMSSNGYYTPKIGVSVVSVGDYKGSSSGLPAASSTKVEWSEEIDFDSSDIPYPPDLSEWQNYVYPMLSGLTEGSYYWMILEHDSGNSEYWDYYYDPNSTYQYGDIAISWDDGVNWSTNAMCPAEVPDGDMCFRLGWKEKTIVATAKNQNSIDLYGRYFKKINDTNITSDEEAQARANLEVSGMGIIPKKGNIVVNGSTDIDLTYKLSGSFANFDIYEKMGIVSYTQTIDARGFTTTINYGKHPFDISRKLADLERELT